MPPSCPADDQVVGLRLGHTGCDRAYANLGNQLDANARLAICILQIMNQAARYLRSNKYRDAAADL